MSDDMIRVTVRNRADGDTPARVAGAGGTGRVTDAD